MSLLADIQYKQRNSFSFGLTQSRERLTKLHGGTTRYEVRGTRYEMRGTKTGETNLESLEIGANTITDFNDVPEAQRMAVLYVADEV
jgi:hypothetical protein